MSKPTFKGRMSSTFSFNQLFHACKFCCKYFDIIEIFGIFFFKAGKDYWSFTGQCHCFISLCYLPFIVMFKCFVYTTKTLACGTCPLDSSDLDFHILPNSIIKWSGPLQTKELLVDVWINQLLCKIMLFSLLWSSPISGSPPHRQSSSSGVGSCYQLDILSCF